MRISLPCVLALAACGGGDDGTSKEGIYTIDTWTENTTSCDAEGPSVKATRPPLVYVKNDTFIVSFVNVKSCDDAADCKMLANDKDTVHFGEFAFDQGSDGSGWTTHNAFAFSFPDGSPCEGDVSDTKLTFSGTSFRIEERRTEITPYPPSTGEDECPDDKTEEAAKGKPCTQLEVVTGTFMSKF